MAKLSKKEKAQIEMQIASASRRDMTWVGIRPVVMKSKKHDIKATRRETRKLCAAF